MQRLSTRAQHCLRTLVAESAVKNESKRAPAAFRFESVACLVLAFSFVLAGGCSPGNEHTEHNDRTSDPFGHLHVIDLPTEAAALAPNLTVTPANQIIATWLEKDGSATRLHLSELRDQTWSPPEVVVTSTNMFANWADLPGILETNSGDRLAHWLHMLGETTYAYGVELATWSPDEADWQANGLVHPDDESPTEHGFVSSVLLDGERARLFWLDGREMASEGPMQLRTAVVDLGQEDRPVGPSSVLDSQVCECCSTDAARTDVGPIVVYRDRQPDETRDIWLVRGDEHTTPDGSHETHWSEPQRVSTDGWQIQGCPVNGPAIAASGQHVAVAWFTAANNVPMVKIAFSTDAGTSFSTPVILDQNQPLGRVDLELGNEGAFVSWLARRSDEEAEVRIANVSHLGELAASRSIAPTTLDRKAGVPRLVRTDRRLVLSWPEGERIKTGLFELAD